MPHSYRLIHSHQDINHIKFSINHIIIFHDNAFHALNYL